MDDPSNDKPPPPVTPPVTPAVPPNVMELFRKDEAFQEETFGLARKLADAMLRKQETEHAEVVHHALAQQRAEQAARMKTEIIKTQLNGWQELGVLLPDEVDPGKLQMAVNGLRMRLQGSAVHSQIAAPSRPPTAAELLRVGMEMQERPAPNSQVR